MQRSIYNSLIALCLLSGAANAQDCTTAVSWTPPEFYVNGDPIIDPVAEIERYELDFGTQSGVYSDTVMLLSDQTGRTVDALDCYTDYYFVVRACITGNICSADSNELQQFVGGLPGTISNLVAAWEGSSGEPVMAAYEGYEVVDADAGNVSVSVTVPSGATGAVVLATQYDGGSGGVNTVSSFSLGGQTGTIITNEPDTGAPNYFSGIYVGEVSGFSTGSQTFAWNWNSDEAISQNGHITIYFVSDVNTADIVDNVYWDRGNAAAAVSIDVVPAATDQLFLFRSSRYIGGTAAPDIDLGANGTETEIYANEIQNTDRTAASHGTFSSTATQTVNIANENYSTLIGVSLNDDAGGGGLSIPVAMHSYRNLR